MVKPLLAVLAALCLSACATPGQPTPADALATAATVTADALQTWCALPPATRSVLRDRLTNGLQFVRCPDDVAP